MQVNHQDRHDPARSQRPGAAVGRAWQWLVEGFAALGTVLIGVLMIIICADIVARNLMGASLPLVSELGALLLVMIVSLQLATTIRSDRLARTDLFIVGLKRSRPRAAALLSAVFNLVGAIIIGLIAYASIRILGKDWSSDDYIGIIGIATLPTWPFRALILAGMTIAALEFIVRMISDLRSVMTREARP
jgi:TRAP-type C4-dicarboxylate transport system permease small subunit